MSNFLHKVDLKAKQAEFANYIRDPNAFPCPEDVKPERMQMYRSLFFNNVESFLSSNFPVLRKIFTDAQWQHLAQDFFARHPCTSPYFSEIPEEFIAYLQNERVANIDDYPFLLELAHYEWVEMALSIAQEELAETEVQQIANLQQTLRLSPLVWILAYQFPVHKISPDYLPLKLPEQPSYLAVYRNTEDQVNFIELSAMSYYLLHTLQEQQTISIADCLSQVLPDNPDESLENSALEAIQQFVNKQVILVR